jgi:hypothetical protein
MSANTPIPRSKPKPSPSEDEIIEMVPPEGSGFSGTVKLYRELHANEIRILTLRGYSMKDAA